MTLQRQLLMFTLILCFFLFAGVWVYKLQSTRLFLENQLAVHAQDTATSLALSLSPLVADNDLAAVETMMNAIFDRGYYREILFSDVAGEVVSKRMLPVEIEKVPAWFIDMIPLETPTGEAIIMDGWKRAGTLLVQSHPGYAYQTLWQTFIRISIYFLLTGLIVFIAGSLAMQYLLRPLRRVESQAEAICRREYEIQEQIPKTRELKNVVVSMNRMTAKVREMFEEQAATADKLRRNSYGDPLTGLGNRRFLAARIDGTMEGGSRVIKGAYLFIQIRNLQKINDKKGYSAGDELLKRAAEVITDAIGEDVDYAAARLGGGDFGVFLPHADKDDAEQLAARITDALAGLSVEELTVSEEICSVGGVYYNTSCSFRHLLAKADTALLASKHTGPNRWILEPAHCDDDLPTQGKVWWRQNLEQSLADRAINLYGQHVVQTGAPAVPLHLELFSRITIGQGEEVPAGVFIPLAEHARVITDLDRKVIELVLDTYPSWNERSLAVNVSITSILDPGFTGWLYSRLKTLADRSLKLYFELSETSVVRNLEAARDFSHRIAELGHHTGIDHFGRSFSNFGYLRSLRPDYVKIDRAFTRELESDQSDAFFFIGSLRSVAHSLDIKVIGEGVETEAQLAIFKELQVDGFQGFLVEQPKLLTTKY